MPIKGPNSRVPPRFSGPLSILYSWLALPRTPATRREEHISCVKEEQV